MQLCGRAIWRDACWYTLVKKTYKYSLCSNTSADPIRSSHYLQKHSAGEAKWKLDQMSFSFLHLNLSWTWRSVYIYIYIFPIIIQKVQYRVQYFKSLVDPPERGAAWPPGWWRIERRLLSAPPHSLRICDCNRCDFALCLEHFSILDTASNVLVYLQISCIRDTFCHFEWMISCCTWCFSQFGIVVQTTGKLLHTLV